MQRSDGDLPTAAWAAALLTGLHPAAVGHADGQSVVSLQLPAALLQQLSFVLRDACRAAGLGVPDDLPAARAADAAGPTGCRIVVRTFGRFSVLVDGRPVAQSAKAPKRPLDLLKALLAFGGDGVALTSIQDALWPDLDGAAAQDAFDVALHRLRRLLGHPKAVLLRQGRLSIDPQLLWSDAGELRSMLNADDAGPELRAEAVDHLLRLYRGPFLADDDAPWVAPARDRLRSQFLRIAARMAEALEQAGLIAQALDLHGRVIEIDAVAEGFQQGLVRCLRALGREAEALDAQRRHRRLLYADPQAGAPARRLEPAGARA